MKLIMENWRNYVIKEMRDRYLPPGEDPSDPSPEEEAEFDRLRELADENIEDAMSNPKQIVDIGNDGPPFMVYDEGGDQFFIFDSTEQAQLAISNNFEAGDDSGIFYAGDRSHMDQLSEFIIDHIKQKEEYYQ